MMQSSSNEGDGPATATAMLVPTASAGYVLPETWQDAFDAIEQVAQGRAVLVRGDDWQVERQQDGAVMIQLRYVPPAAGQPRS